MKTLRAISIAIAATVLLALTVPDPALAQSQYGGANYHWVFASDYATTALQGQGTNNFSWDLDTAGPGSCYSYPNGSSTSPFFAFGPTAHAFPLWLQDNSGSQSEVVNPSATSLTGSSCGFSASTSYSHTTFYVKSGTGGLYEALYSNLKTPYPLIVVLDTTWKSYIAALPGSKTPGGEIVGIPSAFGTVNLSIVDITTTPPTIYTWNGSAYNAPGGGTPTVALSTTGAGTGPTGLTVTGSGRSFNVSFTSGTTPSTTATIFTATYLSGTTSTGFNHQPYCTVTPIGPTLYTVGTPTYSGSASAGEVVTVPSTGTALTGSTFYSFHVDCL